MLHYTKRDAEFVSYLTEHINREGFAPSVREIASHFGLTSTSTIHRRLDRLRRLGLIERVGPRAIRIVVGGDHR